MALCQAALPEPVLALGVVVVSRLRRDAHLMSLPATKRRPGQRGPMPTYGKLTHPPGPAGQPNAHDWQPVECVQYGEASRVKEVKEFLATWRPAGGTSSRWSSSARSTAGWRTSAATPRRQRLRSWQRWPTAAQIEQTFKDVKRVWGAGQRQVRNVYACIGAFTVNLVWHSLVENWAWARGRGGTGAAAGVGLG